MLFFGIAPILAPSVDSDIWLMLAIIVLLVPLQAREARLDVAAVEAADAVFLCNAVRGILPLAGLGTRTWLPHPAVAAARRALARLHPAFALDMEHP